jgi:succinate dehydrogenase hydrophobic anchor subunit
LEKERDFKMNIKQNIKDIFFQRFSGIDILLVFYLILLIFIENPVFLKKIFNFFLSFIISEKGFYNKFFLTIFTLLFLFSIIGGIFALTKNLFLKKNIGHGREKDFANFIFYIFVFTLSISIFVKKLNSGELGININDSFIIFGAFKAITFVVLFIFLKEYKSSYFFADRLDDKKLDKSVLGEIIFLAPIFYFFILKALPITEKTFLSYIYISLIIPITSNARRVFHQNS